MRQVTEWGAAEGFHVAELGVRGSAECVVSFESSLPHGGG